MSRNAGIEIMDIHNDPIDYAVMVTDDRVRGLLRERSLQPGRRIPERRAPRRDGRWTSHIGLAEPLLVGCAGLLLGWLLTHSG